MGAGTRQSGECGRPAESNPLRTQLPAEGRGRGGGEGRWRGGLRGQGGVG